MNGSLCSHEQNVIVMLTIVGWCVNCGLSCSSFHLWIPVDHRLWSKPQVTFAQMLSQMPTSPYTRYPRYMLPNVIQVLFCTYLQFQAYSQTFQCKVVMKNPLQNLLYVFLSHSVSSLFLIIQTSLAIFSQKYFWFVSWWLYNYITLLSQSYREELQDDILQRQINRWWTRTIDR